MSIVPFSDYTVQNGHARLSYRKVAELLIISHSTISRLINSGALWTKEEGETLLVKGFDGGALAVLVDYLMFDSSRVRPETVTRCREITRQSSAKGYQDFIDEIAGVTSKVEQPKQLTPHERAHTVIELKEALEAFGIEITNPRFKQELQDLSLDILGIGQKALPGTTETWLGVAERAEQLGYNATQVCKHRSQLGKYVAKQGLECRKEKRLCNGTQRAINLYQLTPSLDSAITEYMDAI